MTYAPAIHDEITTLIGYLEQQFDAIRAAPYGLTEAQCRERPCRSALSVGGIVKHVAYGMEGWIDAFGGDQLADRPLDYAAYTGSFALTDDETMVGVLGDFDARRSTLLGILSTVEPDAESVAPAQPWYGIFDVRPIRHRYRLWHLVEEVARHAGHADIVREQLDGAFVSALVMTREGVPANDFFQPYLPEPGTITS